MKHKKQILSLLPKGTRRSKVNRPDFTSEAGIARRIAENRGQGAGPTYKTWLRVPEFSSSGYRRMAWSPKLGRVVHFFSELEWQVFLYAEFMNSVIDIRENYPLDREKTRAIAKSMGKRHPAPYGTDIVMTCDAYLTVQTPDGPKEIAWTIKYAKALKDPRTMEKLDIEEAYHKTNQVPFSIMTEDSIPSVKIENIGFVRGTLQPGGMDGYSPALLDQIDALSRPLLATTPLGVLCGECDKHLQLEPGTAIRAARYFIASRRWAADMNVPIIMSDILALEAAS